MSDYDKKYLYLYKSHCHMNHFNPSSGVYEYSQADIDNFYNKHTICKDIIFKKISSDLDQDVKDLLEDDIITSQLEWNERLLKIKKKKHDVSEDDLMIL